MESNNFWIVLAVFVPVLCFFAFMIAQYVWILKYIKPENRYDGEYIDGKELGLDVEGKYHVRIEGLGVKYADRSRNETRKTSGKVVVYWHPDFEKGVFSPWTKECLITTRLSLFINIGFMLALIAFGIIFLVGLRYAMLEPASPQ